MSHNKFWRNLILALIITIGLGYLFSIWNTSNSNRINPTSPSFAGNGGSCLSCHNQTTPGVVKQYGVSKHAANKVACIDCHRGDPGGKQTVNHYDNNIVLHPTPQSCSRCHPAQAAQFDHSRHSAAAWYAQTGASAFTDQQLKRYGLSSTGKYNDLYHMEGPDITKMACEVCHGIGKPNADGSFGDCAKCHQGHSFSLAQVRKPEICGSCHLGPDHPQKEIYEESIHGTIYANKGSTWAWNAPVGTLSSKNFDAPTCAICHMASFGAAQGTHDVGQRLSWMLTPAQAQKRTDWETHRVNMQTVCLECHAESSIKTLYDNADKVVLKGNENIKTAQDIIKGLKDDGLIPAAPFSSSIDFKGFEIWHHEGRRMRFGAFMNGPDYVQWHGIYEQLIDLTELKEQDAALRNKGTFNTTSTQNTSKSTKAEGH
ncbi:hydroxylamine oxidoreductase precursor [Desulfosporosinus acididurans]|uniref:Hydroxylamine oxidoreductase n=1 Tax=Desulfosporosinus acididurans TaxID=476652 RepID=A0A0J1IFZ6_9FIRM|nr:multiheme c-type cytochrome [Desulfosporosinus acididurans]KLU63661.1 hydroxylamine oxidoreductase precursor [Desulfosporosinus acididurans]